ncbi:hypothetical protein IX53_00660 [Kosmotoga pacifica]|uniref:Uncharacterized protein n=2 Tax=Kosmotoga pacifica TaxID=1330330 RepID=A0A0G2Z927_9BACT|nr:hypothetical protein IX53_00660 [Kosmotoga pacifica]
MRTAPSIWEILDKVIEGKMLVKQEVHELWRKRDVLERYTETMLVHTSSIVYCRKHEKDYNSKIFRDAEVVKILEKMDEAVEKLSEDEKKVWLWRYQEKMTLEEIGQMLVGLPKRSVNARRYWRIKAFRTLNHIAFELAKFLRTGGT